MYNVSYVIEDGYLEDKIFDLTNKNLNRDDCLVPFYCLKQLCQCNDINLSTYDINTIKDSNVVLYHDMPKKLPEQSSISKSYLIIFESEVVRPDNWDLRKHNFFNKIFTWNDNFVDNVKYFKINFSYIFPLKISKKLKIKKKLITLVAGNKKNNHPLELYSQRVEAIRWFESFHKEDFDFYGVGWDSYRSNNKYINYLVKKFGLGLFFSEKYISYKGQITSKKEVFENYKFAVCYENAKDIPGYITEKIFDCFFSGCVPIYWGANNISSHIPENCFIDKRQFKTYEELYNYLISISESNYFNYLNNIEKFLAGDKARQFKSESFSELITYTIMSDLRLE